MTIHRRAAARDQNEAAIVDALRRVGALVFHLSARDLPDLLVGHRGSWLLLEVKAPAGPRGGTAHNHANLRPGQARFLATAAAAGLPAHVVRSPEAALAALGIELVTPTPGGP